MSSTSAGLPFGQEVFEPGFLHFFARFSRLFELLLRNFWALFLTTWRSSA